jgi:hypothetical protein
VSDYSGMMVQPHKAIVGANAFAHESGIHQDGMLKSRETYEIMSPETIGLARADGDVGVVLGKHSGRNALGTRLRQLGFDLPPPALDDVFRRFKSVADRKKSGMLDEDLLALVQDEVHQPVAIWELRAVQVRFLLCLVVLLFLLFVVVVVVVVVSFAVCGARARFFFLSFSPPQLTSPLFLSSYPPKQQQHNQKRSSAARAACRRRHSS